MKLFCSLLILLCNLVFFSSNEKLKNVDEYDQENIGKDLSMHNSVYFLDNFNNMNSFAESWITSKAKKMTKNGSSLQYDGDWVLEKALNYPLPHDMGLTFHKKNKTRAIATKLFRDFTFINRPLVIQYEVHNQHGQKCGGAYLKLISKERSVQDLSEFNDRTPYTIKFGPEKCGSTNKLNFTFRHKNPLNGCFEEKHCKQQKTTNDYTFTDSKPHLFRLVVNPDNTFSIFVDNKVVSKGSLLEDFDPPVNPPKEIDDPNDKKPEDWDDRAKIPGPTKAKIPDGWDAIAPSEIIDANAPHLGAWLDDKPIIINDTSAEMPDVWGLKLANLGGKCIFSSDEEVENGKWKALTSGPNPTWGSCISSSTPYNPGYKGRLALIDNPNFKGIWKPRKIPNPDFFEDRTPFKMIPIDAVGLEISSVSDRILFDNLILTDDEDDAKKFASLTFDRKIKHIVSEVGRAEELSCMMHELWYYGTIAILFIFFGFLGYLVVKHRYTLPEESPERKRMIDYIPLSERNTSNFYGIN